MTREECSVGRPGEETGATHVRGSSFPKPFFPPKTLMKACRGGNKGAFQGVATFHTGHCFQIAKGTGL